MTREEMATTYERFSAASEYIVGFIADKMLYMARVANIPSEWLNVEKASRNQGENLRLRMKASVRHDLALRATCLGSQDLLTADKYNKGEIFEKLVTEYYGQTWKKDTVPFWEDGDLTVDNIKIQIKLDSATLMNTKQVAKLVA